LSRCIVCNRKIPPNQTHCGDGKCIATKTQIIGRCIKCGGLLEQGRECPATRGRCVSAENKPFLSRAELNEVV